MSRDGVRGFLVWLRDASAGLTLIGFLFVGPYACERIMEARAPKQSSADRARAEVADRRESIIFAKRDVAAARAELLERTPATEPFYEARRELIAAEADLALAIVSYDAAAATARSLVPNGEQTFRPYGGLPANDPLGIRDTRRVLTTEEALNALSDLKAPCVADYVYDPKAKQLIPQKVVRDPDEIRALFQPKAAEK